MLVKLKKERIATQPKSSKFSRRLEHASSPDVLVFINIMIKTYLWTNAPARTMMAITTRTLTTPPTFEDDNNDKDGNEKDVDDKDDGYDNQYTDNTTHL